MADRIDGIPHPRFVGFYTTSFTIGSALSFALIGQLTAWFPWRTAIALVALGPAIAWTLMLAVPAASRTSVLRASRHATADIGGTCCARQPRCATCWRTRATCGSSSRFAPGSSRFCPSVSGPGPSIVCERGDARRHHRDGRRSVEPRRRRAERARRSEIPGADDHADLHRDEPPLRCHICDVVDGDSHRRGDLEHLRQRRLRGAHLRNRGRVSAREPRHGDGHLFHGRLRRASPALRCRRLARPAVASRSRRMLR